MVVALVALALALRAWRRRTHVRRAALRRLQMAEHKLLRGETTPRQALFEAAAAMRAHTAQSDPELVAALSHARFGPRPPQAAEALDLLRASRAALTARC